MSADEPGLRCYGCEHCTHDDRRDDGICLGHCDACQAELAELPIYSREDRGGTDPVGTTTDSRVFFGHG